LNNCNYVFDEGLSMIYINPTRMKEHFAEWKDGRIYYIKCRDTKGNQPSENECSIVVNSVDLGKKS